MFGNTGTSSNRPATPPKPTEMQWENPAQLIARSMALRQNSAAGVLPAPIAEVAPTQRTATAPVDDDRPPRDPVLVPDDGHFPTYESSMDPIRPNFPGGRPESADTRRGPWRLRVAYLTEHHVELDE